MLEATKANVRRVSLQERTLPVGNVVGVNGYKVNKAMLRKSIEDEGYFIHETPHFFVVIRSTFPSVIVTHWFAPTEIDARIGDYILQELRPLGILTSIEDFDAFGAIVGSLFPHDEEQAWHMYATNTLQQFRLLTSNTSLPLSKATIDIFATLYKRVYELHIGESFLDIGCSSGFLPLLMAENFSSLSKVVGIDIRAKPLVTAQALAEELRLTNVQFAQVDVLHTNFSIQGTFDTVVMLHVLEHFTEEAMYQVLAKLLHVTAHRLIIAVPYEQGVPEAIYGHEQIFSQAKLEAVGHWCIQQWNGKGTMWYEACADGLLVVERSSL